jgi:hypothetical protein
MNIEFLNLLKSPYEGNQGRKEKNRGDEPIGVIIHIHMEMSQENSLYSYFKQTKLSFFFFYKIREQEVCGVGTSGKGEDVVKGCRRVNMVQILCTHVYKWKNDTC